jgi:hypothetical protein
LRKPLLPLLHPPGSFMTMDWHAFERDLHQRMAQLMEIDEEELMARVQPNLPVPAASGLQPIEALPVHSYVLHKSTSTSSSFPSIVVPTFAVHWGVVVENTVYHLLFRNQENLAKNSMDPFAQGASIRFAITLHEDDTPLEGTRLRGVTRYSHMQRIDIGKALIEAFGDYHRLFWNCQTFARCYLRLLTGGKDFDRSILLTAQLIVVSPQPMPPSSFFVVLWLRRH